MVIKTSLNKYALTFLELKFVHSLHYCDIQAPHLA